MLDVIKTRRVIRNMTDQPVERAQLEKVLEAGRWAPCGSNHRLLRFVAIQNPLTLRLLRKVSPGMFQKPAAAIVICIDWKKVTYHEIPSHDRTIYIDVGTAMENMLLAAHSIKLGSGPVTSFSKEALRVVLNLPRNISPEVIVCVGHAAPKDQMPIVPKQKVTWQSLTDWERYED